MITSNDIEKQKKLELLKIAEQFDKGGVVKMKKLVLSTRQVEQIYFGESKRFQLIKREEWEQEEKYQTCSFIFKDAQTDLLYKACIGRCGSPFTDWVYDSELMGDETQTYIPVEEKEVVVIEYCEIDTDRITDTEEVTEL